MRKLSSKSAILQSFISRPINAENCPINGDNQPSGTQSREQESREKQSTEKDSKAEQNRERASALAADLERLIGTLIDDNFRLDIARLMQAGMQEAVIMEAARQTGRKRPRNPAAYLRTTLQGYERDGILTAADLEATQGKEPHQQPVDDGYLHPGNMDEEWRQRVLAYQEGKKDGKQNGKV